MKNFLGCFFILFIISGVICEESGEAIRAEDDKKDEKLQEILKRPFNEEMLHYALKKTKEAVINQLKHDLTPAELKDPNLAQKLSEGEKQRLRERFERSFKLDKEEMEHNLHQSMHKSREEVGRLSKEEIDKEIESLVASLGDNPGTKTEL